MKNLHHFLHTPIATVLVIFLSIFLYTKLFGPIPFSVNSTQTIKPDMFRVEGTGEATAVPDTARISVGVTKTAQTVLAAQEQANEIVKKVTDEVKALGIEEKHIKTTNYSVTPQIEGAPMPLPGGRGVPQQQGAGGYTVTQNLEIKVNPLEKANQVVDIATANGANLVGGITFTLNDDTQKKLQAQAREEAVKNAKEKAESLAKAAGITLGKIIDIQEYPTQPPYYGQNYDMMQKSAGEPVQPTEIQPGESTVHTTVTLGYQTY